MMGMFNYVYVDCPECGEEVEFQSKSGSCSLDSNHIRNMPVDDIEGILGDYSSCPNCRFDVHISDEEHQAAYSDFSRYVK